MQYVNFNHKEKYHVDKTRSSWNALRIWNYNVRNESLIKKQQETLPSVGFFFCGKKATF